MPKLSKRHRFFFITYIQVLILGVLVLLFRDKLETSLLINQMNAPILDFFFKYWTLLGTFSLIGPIILYQCFIKYRYALITALSSLTGFFLVQIAKRFIWTDSPRPGVFFENMENIHYVAGVHLHSSHSMPSGHTTGAFALFIALALISKRPFNQLFFLLTAVLVGYSRLYLSQHFLVDVLVGSAIGTFSAAVSYFWLINKDWKLDGSLKTLFKRSTESKQ